MNDRAKLHESKHILLKLLEGFNKVKQVVLFTMCLSSLAHTLHVSGSLRGLLPPEQWKVVVATPHTKMLCCKVRCLCIHKYCEAFENVGRTELSGSLWDSVKLFKKLWGKILLFIKEIFTFFFLLLPSKACSFPALCSAARSSTHLQHHKNVILIFNLQFCYDLHLSTEVLTVVLMLDIYCISSN